MTAIRIGLGGFIDLPLTPTPGGVFLGTTADCRPNTRESGKRACDAIKKRFNSIRRIRTRGGIWASRQPPCAIGEKQPVLGDRKDLNFYKARMGRSPRHRQQHACGSTLMELGRSFGANESVRREWSLSVCLSRNRGIDFATLY